VNVTLYSEGCRSLIEYLTMEQVGISLDERRRILTELFEDPDLSKWLEAYASFIPDVRRITFDLMLNLDAPLSDKGSSSFFEIQRHGFLSAREEGRECMMQKLSRAEAMDYEGMEETVDRYLPPNTPLDLDIYLTIDGFNGGMFRERSVFLSILGVDPEALSIRGLAHEAHHAGVLYWFKRNERWRRWMSEGGPRLLGAELLIYLVAEGLANHLITPRAVSLVERPRSEREEGHNSRVQMLEENYTRLVTSIEDIVKKALNGELDAAREEFKEFSMDQSGVGLPTGHFASARMVAEILNEHGESIIVDLIENPWMLFAVYNDLTEKTHNFSREVVDFYSG